MGLGKVHELGWLQHSCAIYPYTAHCPVGYQCRRNTFLWHRWSFCELQAANYHLCTSYIQETKHDLLPLYNHVEALSHLLQQHILMLPVAIRSTNCHCVKMKLVTVLAQWITALSQWKMTMGYIFSNDCFKKATHWIT